MAVKDTIEKLILPSVESLGYELWAVEYLQGKTKTLRIYIDKEDGITLDDCSVVSQQVGAVLDIEEPISGEYNLEISSPGLERELFKLEHYDRLIGNTIKIKLMQAVDNKRLITGKISKVEGNIITIATSEIDLEIDFNLINKAHLVVDL
jgi:ribosome maturation factor RimP